MVGRQTRTEEVELQDGSVVEVTLRELTLIEIDQVKNLMLSAWKKVSQKNIVDEIIEKVDFEDPVKASLGLIDLTIKEFQESYVTEKEIWKIISGREDVFWLDSCFLSTPGQLFEIFEELNPVFSLAKKKAEKLAEILKLQGITTLSGHEQTQIFSTSSEKDTE